MAAMTTPRSIFANFSKISKNQCMGGCEKIITSFDIDHSFCNSCWHKIFPKKKSVTFKGDDPLRMKKPPCETIVYYKGSSPSSKCKWSPPKHLIKKSMGENFKLAQQFNKTKKEPLKKRLLKLR